jgi:lysophospholipase L1-like esterase
VIPVAAPAFSPLVRARITAGTWAVMGSSTAAGVGATAGNAWADRIAQAYASRGLSIVNLGLGGSVTYNGVGADAPTTDGRPPPDGTHNVDAALAHGIDLLLIGYPSNDTAYGYSADETMRNHQWMAWTALQRGVPTIVISSQPQRQVPSAWAAQTFVAIDFRLSDFFGPCFVEVRSALSLPDNTLNPIYDSGDGQHLNDAGHQVIYDRMKAVIDSGNCVRAR